MRSTIIFILLFLFPVQIIAGSISLDSERVNNKDRLNKSEGTAVLFSLPDGDPEFIKIKNSSLFKSDAPSNPSAGYSAMLLNAADLNNEYNENRPETYTMAGIIGRSLLLPGLGHRRMGSTIRSKLYFALEGAAWIGLGTFMWQSIARKNAYEEYAVAFAGVSGTGRSDDYYENIGNYLSNEGVGGYNEGVMREARDYYPDDREAQLDYIDRNIITGADSWLWETERSYDRYNSLRKGSNSAERRAIYTLFYMLGIRLISSVDAGRMALKINNSGTEPKSDTSIRMEQKSTGVSVFLNRSF